MTRPRLTAGAVLVLWTVLAILAVGAAAFVVGRAQGERARQDHRQLALDSLRAAVVARRPAIDRAAQVVQERTATADRATVVQQTARQRVRIIDSTHARIDGMIEQLPAPMIQLTQASDERHARDSLEILSLIEWGTLWKAQAHDLEVRNDLLEAQLVDERRSRWRVVAKATAIGATLGAVVAAVLGR